MGQFRTGMVGIAGTDYMPPRATELESEFEILRNELGGIADIYDRAIHAFYAWRERSFLAM